MSAVFAANAKSSEEFILEGTNMTGRNLVEHLEPGRWLGAPVLDNFIKYCLYGPYIKGLGIRRHQAIYFTFPSNWFKWVPDIEESLSAPVLQGISEFSGSNLTSKEWEWFKECLENARKCKVNKMNAVFLFPLLDDKHWVLLEVTIVHGKRGDIKVYDSFVDPVNWKLGDVSKKYGGHAKLALEYLGYQTDSFQVLNHPCSVKQPNTHDCGFILLATLMRIVEKPTSGNRTKEPCLYDGGVLYYTRIERRPTFREFVVDALKRTRKLVKKRRSMRSSGLDGNKSTNVSDVNTQAVECSVEEEIVIIDDEDSGSDGKEEDQGDEKDKGEVGTGSEFDTEGDQVSRVGEDENRKSEVENDEETTRSKADSEEDRMSEVDEVDEDTRSKVDSEEDHEEDYEVDEDTRSKVDSEEDYEVDEDTRSKLIVRQIMRRMR